MIANRTPIESKDFNIGLYTRSDIVNANPDFSPNCMDIKWFFDNSIGKRLGSSTSNTVTTSSGGTTGFIIGNALTNNLQAYWKLDEASGNRADSFDGLTLTQTGNLLSITGIRNNAAFFVNGDSQGLIRATTSQIETGNVNFSVAGWFYLNSTSTTIQRTVVGKRDPELDSYTVLLLHCDGADGSTSFPDSSPANHTMTAEGNAQVDTAEFEFGTGSLLLDAVAAALTSPDSADWDFGTGDFTIDFWVRFNATGANQDLIDRADGDFKIVMNSSDNFALVFGGSVVFNTASGMTTGAWYHCAVARSGTDLRVFINGTQLGATVTNSTDLTYTSGLFIGRNSTGVNYLNGWMDEIRISKGIARWTANFTPPTRAYGVQDYEYWLFVNTNNNLTWRLSSSGSNNTTTVQASSIGALNTSTWYNFVAWHSNNSHIGVSVNLSVDTSPYTSGVRVGSAPFMLGSLSDGLSNNPGNYIDARVDEVGFWKRILDSTDRSNLYAGGSGNTFTSGADASAWYSFDFGASMTRWLTVCVGTGIVASSNLGTTFVNIASTRTATYQYLDRSRNVLIATSDAYDVPLYWAGSAGTFAVALALNSAPKAKFSINYQGFCCLLNYMDSNNVISNRGFSYQDENTQLSGTWQDSFDLPSSADDEITGPFILNKFLYVSTRYRIFRLAYTGGNPDWSYIEVKKFGYVPRTVKVFTLKQGQVAVGLDWEHRLRVFDGYDDQIISDNVENYNNYCEFAMDRISNVGSGLLVSNAEFDVNEQEYRLNLAIGAASTQTTHALVLNARTLALYPYSNQPFNAMCMAQSNNQQFLMAFDRSGFCHILNSGNLDAGIIPINEIYDSPLLFKRSPSEITKNKQINFFFSVNSCGTVYFQERFDFSNVFSEMKPMRNYQGEAEFLETESTIQLVRTVDLPSVQNIYQFRITSSSGTANPWQLNHYELFNTPFGIGRGGGHL